MENTQRFTGRAEVYDNYRPGYTDEMYDYIYANVLKADGAVADIGSCTGILSEGFLKRGSKVYGVEPNADMRAAGEKRLQEYEGFSSVIGTGENTSLEADSVYLITAASAFHWFDPALFYAECRRILRPGGSVAIIYNKRDNNSAFVQELTNNSERLDSAAPR
jgi:SAM-dependent methyltransferase